MIAKMCVKSTVISVRPNWMKWIDKQDNLNQSLSVTYIIITGNNRDWIMQSIDYSTLDNSAYL